MRFNCYVLSAALASALLLVSGCGSSSPVAPSAVGSSTRTAASTPVAVQAKSVITQKLDVPAPSGQWTLTVPDGVPQSGCMTIADLNNLDLPTVDGVKALQWQIVAADGHTDPIFIAAQFFHKETPGCDPVDQQTPRELDITGHSNFVAGETGTTTLGWLTDRCNDGGRYEIDIMAEQVLTDEGDTARQTSQLIVDCGTQGAPQGSTPSAVSSKRK